MKSSQRGQMRDIKERAIEATKIKIKKKKKKKREGATLLFFFLRSTLVLQSSTCTS